MVRWWAFGHLFTREPERISMEPVDVDDDYDWYMRRLPVHIERTEAEKISRVVQFPGRRHER